MKLKKLLAVLMTLCLLGGYVPAAWAATNYTCGDNLTWSLADGVLTISGEGDMYDYTYDTQYKEVTAPWGTYLNQIEKIVIMDGVTSIGDYAFYLSDAIKEVVIGNSVSNIGEFAFAENHKLAKIILGSGLETIEYSAFFMAIAIEEVHVAKLEDWFQIVFQSALSTPMQPNNTAAFYVGGEKITEMTIPEGVETLSAYALASFDQLSVITLPKSIQMIGENNFTDCTNVTDIYYQGDLESWLQISFAASSAAPCSCGANLHIDGQLLTDAVIPEGITEISDYAFYKCATLSNVSLPDTVARIGHRAFAYCNVLQQINLPEGLETIGDYSFRETLLTDLIIPESVTSLGKYAFLRSGITRLQFPSGLTEIPEGLLKNCSSLAEIEIPGATVSLGNYALAGTTITSVIIPDTVTEVGEAVFADCVELESATLGKGLKSIGKDTFLNAVALKTVAYTGDLEGWMSLNFAAASSNPCCYGAQLYFGGELVTAVTIPEAVTAVPQYAFYGCESLTDMVVPDHVTEIADYAFYGCKNLADVQLSAALTEINAYTFGFCESLEALALPDSVESIKGYAFYKAEKLSSINIPASMNTIAFGTFSGCSGLKSLTIPANITTLENSAIGTATERVFFEGDLPAIASAAFSGVTAYCYYPAGNETYAAISSYDYGGNLVWVPRSESGTVVSDSCGDNLRWSLSEDGVLTVTGTGEMYDYSFADAVYAPWYDQTFNITAVVLEEGVTSVGDAAFYTCTAVTSVTLPESLTAIGAYSFYKCENLTSITLPENLTTIGQAAFYGNGLRRVVIPNGTHSIGPSTFSGCENMYSAVLGDSITEIPAYAFSSCYVLGSVSMPSRLKTIGNSAFSNCYELDTFTLPEGLTSIGNLAFACCGFSSLGSGFYSVTFPSTLESIGDSAFGWCDELQTVTFTGGKITLGSTVFRQINKRLSITFQCVAPIFSNDTFGVMTYAATAYYPSNHASWTEDVLQNYGGNITWIGQEMDVTDPEGGTGGDSGNSGEGEDSGEAGGSGDGTGSGESEGGETGGNEGSGGSGNIGTDGDGGTEGGSGTGSDDGDTSEDGTGTGTGGSSSTVSAVINGASISLGDSLDLHFFIEAVNLSNSHYAVLTRTYADSRENHVVTVPYSEWNALDDGTLYVTYGNIAAKEMGDTISVVIYNGNGEVISAQWDDSVKAYAVRMLEKTEDAELRTLLVDMLNYGAAAQSQFGYDTANLVNAGLTDEQKGFATASYETENDLVSGTGRAGTTLTLKSRITLDFIFKNTAIGTDYTGLYAVATYTDHYGNEIETRIDTVKVFNTNLGYVSVPGLAVADYGQTVTCTVYDAEGNVLAWATDSIEGYAHRMKGSLPQIVETIVKFGNSSYNYFH